LSDECEQFFIEESCFYECDKNLGKWRKFADCMENTTQFNEWEIENMPIKVGRCRLTPWIDHTRFQRVKLKT